MDNNMITVFTKHSDGQLKIAYISSGATIKQFKEHMSTVHHTQIDKFSFQGRIFSESINHKLLTEIGIKDKSVIQIF